MSTLTEILNQSQQLIQNSEITRAIDLLLNTHQTHPKSPQVNYLLGVSYQAARQTNTALMYLDKACVLDKKNALFHFQCASALSESGDIRGAIKKYKAGLKIDPNNYVAHYNLGVAHKAINDHSRAAQSIKRCIALNSSFYPAYNVMANLCFDTNKIEMAINHLKSSLAINSSYLPALIRLARAYRDTGENGKSLELLKKALPEYTNNPDIYYGLAKSEYNLLDYDSSLVNINKALSIEPSHYQSISLKSLILIHDEKYEDAASLLKELIKKYPDKHEAYANLATVYFALFRYEESLELAQLAVGFTPDNSDNLYQLAKSYYFQHDIDKAIEYYEKAILIDKDFTEAHWGLAQSYLIQGNFSSGFDEYEWRKKRAPGTKRTIDVTYAEAAEDDLAGSTVLLLPEQGIGDEVMFTMCIHRMVETSEHVIIACDSRLKTIFKESFPECSVVSITEFQDGKVPDHVPTPDYYYLAGSAFAQFNKPEPSSISPHLVANDTLVRSWYKELSSLPGRLKIGISWKGGAESIAKHSRSMSLEKLGSVLTDDHSYINLQYGDVKKEIDAFNNSSNVKIVDYTDIDPITELDNFLALIDCLDLVISIDNSTVHFSAAVGCETWTLIPYVPDWRWLTTGDRSVWYTDMRLYRQDHTRRWNKVLQDVKKDLRIFKK